MVRLTAFLNGEQFLDLELESGREYIAGRSEDNDIPLRDLAGVSRKHFRIFEEDGMWKVQVISKFGELVRHGSKVTSIDLDHSLTYTLGPYEFHVAVDAAASDSHQPMFEGPEAFAPIEEDPIGPLENPPSIRHGTTADATFVGQLEVVPYLRIYNDGKEEPRKLQLVGNLWTIGRDASCEVTLDIQQVSRRQFSIAAMSNGYFITDLGSSNGTNLNDKPLPPNEPVQLRSGDQITVRSIRILFEMHTPDFQRQVAILPPAQDEYGAEAYSEEYYPQAMAAGGYDNYSGPPQSYYPPPYPMEIPPPQASKKLIRVVILALAIVAVIAAFLPSSHKSHSNKTTTDDTFSKLTPEQQTLVRDSYELAKNLISHRKWEMALAELQKVHKMVPNYQESRALEIETQRANELRIEEMAVEQEQQRQQELKQKVSLIVEGCKMRMGPKVMPPEIQTCLAPAMDLDPSNEMAKQLMTQAETNLEEMEHKTMQQESYRHNVKMLENLCEKASATAKSGPLLEAQKSLQKCIASPLPDPKSLKVEAKRTLALTEASITKTFKESMSTAEQAYAKGDYKGAVAALRVAHQVGPDNPDYDRLMQKVDRDSNNKMKLIYSDSVLEESLGQIESAKEKWQKIIDIGLTESEYYKRAKRKLQRYGVM